MNDQQVLRLPGCSHSPSTGAGGRQAVTASAHEYISGDVGQRPVSLENRYLGAESRWLTAGAQEDDCVESPIGRGDRIQDLIGATAFCLGKRRRSQSDKREHPGPGAHHQ